MDIIKSPSETYPLTVDYTDKLPDSTVITAGTATIYDFSNDTDVTSTMKPGGITATATSLTMNIVAGTADKDYLLVVTATVTGSIPLVNYFRIRIKAPSL